MEYFSVCGINKFVERDVDMLLAEELRVNAGFGKWIMDKFGVSDLVFPANHINVSVVEDGSEADIVATFRTTADLNHRLFVENKIDAPLMPEQLERYARRAEGEKRRQLISGFSILFFTPSVYLETKLSERRKADHFRGSRPGTHTSGGPTLAIPGFTFDESATKENASRSGRARRRK